MPLQPNQRLGPYTIVAPLGAGGMGEVYRARDTALDRDVAIKVLPDTAASDPDRLARLTREARTLAALNHPNIAQVYGLQDAGGAQAIVMELAEGEDLSALIARGPMPLATALPVARQIAGALETAHDAGIIHRDLKPANVKVRPDGTVKVLDFGLAKAMAAFETEAGATITAAGTQQGVIIGTPAYMAPEQARGLPADKRADIWAFGAVLYEMLTGRRAFDGDAFTDVIAAVLREEVDLNRLPADTPPRLRELVARCLTSDVKQRLRDIGEARIALAAIERGESPAVEAVHVPQPPHRWREPVAWAMAALAIVAAVIVNWPRAGSDRDGAAAGAVRLSVLPPPGLVIKPDSTNVAISPDGRMVAFAVGPGLSAEAQLWVRALDSPVARRLEGADGAYIPFWSPDSQRIAFFAGRKLKTIAAAGGAPEVICDAPFGRGGAWAASNSIVFAPDANGPLYRVSANGGTPVALTTLDEESKETGHRFPVFLPDGDHFLYAALPGTGGTFHIVSGSLQDPSHRTLIGSMENTPAYAEPGWLLFTRDGVLAAQPFDARALRLTGEAISLGDQPGVPPSPAAYDAGHRVSASVAGVLAYYLDPVANTTVQWMDLSAKVTGTVAVPPARYAQVRIAPDGSHAALERSDSPATSSVWLADLARGSARPLSSAGGRNTNIVWSPDSTRVLYATDRSGVNDFYEKAIGASSPERRILHFSDLSATPIDWPTESLIVFNSIDPATKWNIYRAPTSGSEKPGPVLSGPFIEVGGWVSPDGRWFAYLSEETGRQDLFVQSFPNAGSKLQISTSGAQWAWWTAEGRQLLYLTRDQTLWRVDVDLRGATARAAAPVQIATFPASLVAMDLAPDGQRFLAIVPERSGVGTVAIVDGWKEALQGKR